MFACLLHHEFSDFHLREASEIFQKINAEFSSQIFLMQDMKKCNPEGRVCIERNSMNTFNCSVSCEGIYAGVEWFKDNKGIGKDKFE